MKPKLPPKVAIIEFPGSNCDRDMLLGLKFAYGLDAMMIWHQEESLPEHTGHVIIPGGFSFGDYNRAGTLAAISPVMSAVKQFAYAGGPVLGVCNGFQILCEAKMLPGALLRNVHDRFVCKVVSTKWRAPNSMAITRALQIPIAHRDGRYFIDDEGEAALRKNDQIILQYEDCNAKGEAIVNGSKASIAGIACGPSKNIWGMMPHPERALDKNLRGTDGLYILDDFFGFKHE